MKKLLVTIVISITVFINLGISQTIDQVGYWHNIALSEITSRPNYESNKTVYLNNPAILLDDLFTILNEKAPNMFTNETYNSIKPQLVIAFEQVGVNFNLVETNTIKKSIDYMKNTNLVSTLLTNRLYEIHQEIYSQNNPTQFDNMVESLSNLNVNSNDKALVNIMIDVHNHSYDFWHDIHGDDASTRGRGKFTWVNFADICGGAIGGILGTGAGGPIGGYAGAAYGATGASVIADLVIYRN